MSAERHCKVCGQTGHYAKTCARRESASPTAAMKNDPTPEKPAKAREKGRAPTAAPTAAKPVVDRLLDPVKRPWLHVDRELGGHADSFVHRHRWRHDTTGDEIVATVPVPSCGDRFATAEGLVVFRREKSPESIARAMPSAHVEMRLRDGTVLVVQGAPSGTYSALRIVGEVLPMVYGEGML